MNCNILGAELVQNSQQSQQFCSKSLPNRPSRRYKPNECHEKPNNLTLAPHLCLPPFASLLESSAEQSSLQKQSVLSQLASEMQSLTFLEIRFPWKTNRRNKNVKSVRQGLVFQLPDPLAPTRRHRDPGDMWRLKSQKSGGCASYANCMPLTLIPLEFSSSCSALEFEASLTLSAMFGSAKSGSAETVDSEFVGQFVSANWLVLIGCGR